MNGADENLRQLVDQGCWTPVETFSTGDDSDCSPWREAELLERYAEAADAIIIAPYGAREHFPVYEKLQRAGTPLAFIDRYVADLGIDAVVSDNLAGGRYAARHLAELGHRRVAVLGVGGAVSMQHRVDGFREGLAEFGLSLDSDLIWRCENPGFDTGVEAAMQLRRDHPEVTAAFCCRDDVAWGCIQQLGDDSVALPDAFSVVGYDDNEDICSRIRPALTTVRQRKEELGEAAADLVLQQMTRGKSRARTVATVPVELVVRRSTAAPTTASA
jgi:DNA-binding LacI/PurR family transcriptional regulator